MNIVVKHSDRSLSFVLFLSAHCLFSSVALSESYDIQRTFEPIPYTVGNPTGNKILNGVLNLTGIIPVDPVQVVSNDVHQFEGIGIGHQTEALAWAAAVTGRNFRITPTQEPATNAGMFSVTRPNPYSGWNAYLHVIQNRLFFYPAESDEYIFPEGHTGNISRVLVGSLGDWVMPDPYWALYFNESYPMADHIGPYVDWNKMKNVVSETNRFASANLETQFKLRPRFIVSPNNGDCDSDGIVDYADGYNLDAINGNEDDECICRNVTLWRVEIPEYLDPDCVRLKFQYEYSNPSLVSLTNGIPKPAKGSLRLWRTDTSGLRRVVHGEYAAADLGLSETNRQLNLEIEAVATNSWYSFWGEPPPAIEVSLWGEGNPTCSNNLYWANPHIGYYSANNSDYFIPGSYDQADVDVINPRLIPDWNHDRVINTSDYNQASTSNPFRFWVNDDNDDSSDAKLGDDIDVPGSIPPDSSNGIIDGTRDLIDFFPVFLDLKSTLEVLGTINYRYRIKYRGYGSAGIVITDLTPINAGSYLTNITIATALVETGVVHKIDGRESSYITLGSNILSGILNGDKGVILVELNSSGNERLQVEIRTTSGGLVHTAELPLSASGVENMFRHKNLRAAVDKTGGASDRIDAPTNLPDFLTTDKHFIFVHGFNVNGEEARAWNSEMFKRLYWSGSHAKFHGVTWYGNQTDIGFSTINYHINIKNAFIAGGLIKSYTDTLSGEIIVAGHSMGNVVLSAAIEDFNLAADKYLMINAAVSLEAYDQSIQDDETLGWEGMMHCEWRDNSNANSPPTYDRRLWASDWYRLFPESDARSRLKWANRFTKVLGVAYHFYSDGEDILENFTGEDGCFFAVESEFVRGAWVKQEKLKGRTSLNIGGSNYGGWGFNTIYDGHPAAGFQKPSPESVNNIPPNVLRTTPFFLPGPESRDELYTHDHGSNYASTNHAELIGGMIPALTYSSGANELQLLDILSGESRNYDMNSLVFLSESWPRQESSWLHSDIVNISFVFTFKLFDSFISIGNLNK